MPTLTEYTIRSVNELRTCLEDYTAHDGQGLPGNGGDEVGDLQKLDRLGRLMAQNRLIDLGMRRLLRSERLHWKVLNLYYRHGMWAERRGWLAPARVLGMPAPVCFPDVRCRIPGDDRMHLSFCSRGQECEMWKRRFEEHLDRAVESLFHAINERSERTVDS